MWYAADCSSQSDTADREWPWPRLGVPRVETEVHLEGPGTTSYAVATFQGRRKRQTRGLVGHRRGARLCEVLWASEKKRLWMVTGAPARKKSGLVVGCCASRGAGASVWKVWEAPPHAGTALGEERLRLLGHLFLNEELLLLLSLPSKVFFIWKHACLIHIFF